MAEYDAVKSSFSRAMVAKPALLDDFYGMFLGSHPEIKSKLAGVDRDRHKTQMRRAINHAIAYANGSTGVSKKELERISELHSKSQKDAPPDLHHFWADAVVETIAAADPQWEPKLEFLWREVLEKTARFIASAYES